LRDIEVKPFSREDLAEFAENILGTRDKAIIDHLADDWKGYPLELGKLVSWFRKNQLTTSFDLLQQLRYLRPECVAATDKEILQGLRKILETEEDLVYLATCCAVPRWYGAAVLRAMIGSDVTTSQSQIMKLSDKWFVESRNVGGYQIREGYRGPLLRSLIQNDRDMFSKWSRCCYEYLQSNAPNNGECTGTSREIESIYHLMAFNVKEALIRYNDLRYSFERGKRLDLMTFLQDTIQQHIDINPQVDDVFRYWIDYGHAMISYKSGNESQALQSYEKLLKALHHPDVGDLKFLRARVLCAKGDLTRWRTKEASGADVAIKCYKEAIGLWNNLLKERENVASTVFSRDEIYKSIAETYMAMAKLEETHGSLLEGLNHFQSALEAYRLCKALGPSYGRTLKWMARSLRLMGKWGEAHRRFDEAEEALNALLEKAKLGDSWLNKRVEEINTRLQNVRNSRAALWKEEGKWKEAKEILEQVVAFHNIIPEETRNREELGIALIDLGDVLRMQGNYIEAKQIYIKAQENLQGSKRNKGFPLLGLAEIAVAESNKEEAVKFLSKAEEAFLEYKDLRKLSEISLCRAKLTRKVNPGEALANLETAWKWIRKTSCTYTKSAALVELSELVNEAEHDSKRCKNYLKQAIALASQKQGIFADHLARLNFIEGRIAGENEPVYALPAFIKAMAWAVRHNPLTLQRTFSEAEAWRNARLSTGTKIAHGKAETLAQEAEAVVWQSEEIALSTLPEESQAAFKDGVEELKRVFVPSDV